MATPTEPSENFLREVEENLRRDRVADFFKDNGRWIAIGVTLFLAVVAGLIYYRDHQRSQAEQAAEALTTTLTDVTNGKVSGADARLATVADQSKGATRAAADFARAALALQTGDRKAALTVLRATAEDKAVPEAYRQLATLRAVSLDFDNMTPDAVIAALEPLRAEDGDFAGSAGELVALAQIKKKDLGAAKATVDKTLAVPSLPETLKQRLTDLSMTLAAQLSAPAAPAPAPAAPAPAPAPAAR